MNSLHDTVISNGFCVGCGVCCSASGGLYSIKLNGMGMYEADKEQDCNDEDKVLNSCPFYSKITESNISEKLYRDNIFNSVIGFYLKIGVGYVKNNEARLESSSGGLTTWILCKLMESKEIDAVIHVKNSDDTDLIFEYSISSSVCEVVGGRKTRYYPIELSHVLEKVKNSKKRFAVVGVPCFIKALRLLQENTSDYSSIKFFVGLLCGQLKSKNYSELLRLQTTNLKGRLIDVDYRLKKEKDLSFNYITKFTIDFNGKQLVNAFSQSTTSLFGTDWGMGMFKYKSCDVCDDVFNETADIVLGDAWIEPYINDWKGTNIVIIRNSLIRGIIERGITDNEIFFEDISEKKCIDTQGANIRHRQNLISYRLKQFEKSSSWIPEKRNFDEFGISSRHLKIQKMRLSISSSSHKYFLIAQKFNSFLVFKMLILPRYVYYKFLYKGVRVFLPYSLIKLIKKVK